MTDREMAWLETVIGAGQLAPADTDLVFQTLLRRLKRAEEDIRILESKILESN